MNAGKPGRGADQFPLRLPDGMRERIKTRAAANNRSMNAEIVSLLEEALIDRVFSESDELPRATGPLGRRFDIPDDTPNAVIDEAIQKAIARALRGLEIRRVPATKTDDGSDK